MHTNCLKFKTPIKLKFKKKEEAKVGDIYTNKGIVDLEVYQAYEDQLQLVGIVCTPILDDGKLRILNPDSISNNYYKFSNKEPGLILDEYKTKLPNFNGTGVANGGCDCIGYLWSNSERLREQSVILNNFSVGMRSTPGCGTPDIESNWTAIPGTEASRITSYIVPGTSTETYIPNAYLDIDGKGNCEKFIQWAEENNADLPAINSVYDGTWYLPAFSELAYIYLYKASINKTLLNLNIKPIPMEYYWSSTQFSSNSLLDIGFNNGSTNYYGYSNNFYMLGVQVF